VTTFQATFAALILAQAAHSVEEYVGRLYDVFPPARLVAGLVSNDRERGFIIVNAALIAFGAWCVLGPARRGLPAAAPLAWFWVVLETINGIGHPLWALSERRYTPGAATAPLLLALALFLAWQLRAGRRA